MSASRAPSRLGARLLDHAATLALAALAAVAAGGLVLTLADLVGLSQPLVGWYMTIDHDAQHLALGGPLFQDPDEGYTGVIYTPGLAAVLSVLHRVHLWPGWGSVVGAAGVVALAAVAARCALPSGGGWRDGVRAAGVGALALWLTTPLEYDLLYEIATDHAAWPLALGGLLCGARAHASRRAAVATVVLLTGAFWCKQTTGVAAVALAAWLVALAALGDRRWRFVGALLGALLAANLALLGVLDVLTDGWQYELNFALPSDHPRTNGAGTLARYALGATPAALLAGALWVAAARRGHARRDGAASLLAAFLPFALAGAAVGASKAGGVDNNFLGVIWTLGLLAAMAWRRAQGDPAARLRANALVVAALAALHVTTLAGSERLTLRDLKHDFVEPPPELLVFAESRSLYHPAFSDLDARREGRVYRDLANTMDLLAAGRQPRDLVRMLLAREVDGVVPFSAIVPGGGIPAWVEEYASGHGEREANYLWKLDRVIAAGYEAAGQPAGIVVRRPGGSTAPWIGRCFGPFALGGVELRIRRGGGLWCTEDGRPGVIVLRETPAPWSELTAGETGALRGRIAIDAPTGGGFRIEHGGWRLEGRRGGAAWRLRATSGGQERRLSAPAGTGALDLTILPGDLALTADDGGVTAGGAPSSGELRLWAPRAGPTTFDLSDARAAR